MKVVTTIKAIFSSSNEAVSDPMDRDKNKEAEDLKDRHKNIIKKSIRNCRYAYKNDGTVKGIILNNITTANYNYRITVKEDKNNPGAIDPSLEKSRQYIEDKCKEWDLDNIMNQMLLKWMRDGPCFIEKVIKNGSLKIRFLAYDEEKYKMKIIRNPQTDDILGFKQKVWQSKDVKNWQNIKYDKLENDKDWEEYNYLPEYLIYATLLEEGGKSDSLLAAVLDSIDGKMTLEQFMLSAAHKAGQIIGITVGNESKKSDNLPTGIINRVINYFKNPISKDVVLLPEGIGADVIGSNGLPDLPSFLKHFKSEIFIALQTPEALFSTESSNRSTAQVQADDKTGYAVFIAFLRKALKKYLEQQLIDHELRLRGRQNAIGKILIEFGENNPEPLENVDEANKVAENKDIDENTGKITDNNPQNPDGNAATA
jgi:hypothetical protein